MATAATSLCSKMLAQNECHLLSGLRTERLAVTCCVSFQVRLEPWHGKSLAPLGASLVPAPPT